MAIADLQEIDVASDIRQIISDRLHQLGKSKYWLAEQLEGKVSRASVYNLLNAKKPSKNISVQALAHIFQALDIDVISRPRK
jgi:hypothetical protein